MNLVRELHKHERKEYSQNGEDGVIERLFALLGVTNRFYVELGTGPGVECNTRLLRERGWNGVMLDRDFANPLETLTVKSYCRYVASSFGREKSPTQAAQGGPDLEDVMSVRRSLASIGLEAGRPLRTAQHANR